jgi:rhomboid protease GluP
MSTAPTFRSDLPSLLRQRVPKVWVTEVLILANLLVFLVMLLNGAGFWHSPNQIQLAWGANFAPATQDGEWWRLASALFLHFGAMHLGMNLLALWDGGRLVERMYGHGRFILLYITSGLMGNFLSLVVQGNSAVSGGASGAIFGVYGALLTYLWISRRQMERQEFRWLFGGASIFSILTIGSGFVIPGIDNSAHIGGFVSGLLAGALLLPPHASLHADFWKNRVLAMAMLLIAGLALFKSMPKPAYRWHDELQVRQELTDFLREDEAARRSWQEIMTAGKRGDITFEALAGRIEEDVTQRYAESFEELSALPDDPAIPSAKNLDKARQYAQKRRDSSKALADALRQQAEKQKESSLITLP